MEQAEERRAKTLSLKKSVSQQSLEQLERSLSDMCSPRNPPIQLNRDFYFLEKGFQSSHCRSANGKDDVERSVFPNA